MSVSETAEGDIALHLEAFKHKSASAVRFFIPACIIIKKAGGFVSEPSRFLRGLYEPTAKPAAGSSSDQSEGRINR